MLWVTMHRHQRNSATLLAVFLFFLSNFVTEFNHDPPFMRLNFIEEEIWKFQKAKFGTAATE